MVRRGKRLKDEERRRKKRGNKISRKMRSPRRKRRRKSKNRIRGKAIKLKSKKLSEKSGRKRREIKKKENELKKRRVGRCGNRKRVSKKRGMRNYRVGEGNGGGGGAGWDQRKRVKGQGVTALSTRGLGTFKESHLCRGPGHGWHHGAGWGWVIDSCLFLFVALSQCADRGILLVMGATHFCVYAYCRCAFVSSVILPLSYFACLAGWVALCLYACMSTYISISIKLSLFLYFPYVI